jgi:lipid-binding SYLF domain-containing protein
MIRVRFALAVAACIAAAPQLAHAQAEQQELVDRATLAAQDMLNDHDGHDAQTVLRQARAVMICPRVFRAGFLFGGQGGDCVLVARDGNGSWSSPAFYGMGSGSFGFQAGLQDSEVMMMILTDRGLRAVMDDQFKIGADAGATFVEWGGGIEGATTGAIGADIVGFTRSRGLFAGIALSGSILSTHSDWNRAYYGKEEAAQQIVISMDANNPGASPLREVLGRYGSSVTATSGTMPLASNTYGQPAPQPLAAQPLAPIQRQSLPPPSSHRY